MVRPSSSRSEGGLLGGVLARGAVPATVDDAALLRAMLDAEAALARANAAAGVVDAGHADAVAAACDPERFDIPTLGDAAAASGNPVVPLVRALAERVGEPAAGAVHVGATSQDILDTAWMLCARESLSAMVADLEAAADTAADLAEAHRDTVCAGRTLLQQALPTTFGLKAAGWLTGLDAATLRLREVREARLSAQLGGAVGTLAALGADGGEVARRFAAELGLVEPLLPWHSERTRITELAAGLGAAAAAVSKVAHDVVLLAQTEVAEVREDGGDRGGSSTLPHKRNPVAAVSATACAARAPALVAALLTAAGRHEHERAAGAWHAEWAPLRDLFVSAGSAASWLREVLERLEVDAGAMRANLDRTGDVLLAERFAAALAPALGRIRAHDTVREAAARAAGSGRSLAAVLGEKPEVGELLDADALAELSDPVGYLGVASSLVDAAVIAHRGRRRGPRPHMTGDRG